MGERTDPFIQQTGDCGMEFAEGRMLRCQQDAAAHAVQPEGSGLQDVYKRQLYIRGIFSFAIKTSVIA